MGEIGEEVVLRVGGETEPAYRILLDDPEGNAARLPQVRISYLGKESALRFRISDSTLHFGRLYNPDLFDRDNKWISRQHFDLNIAQESGQLGYELSAQVKHGMAVDGTFVSQGSKIFLLPGRHMVYSIKERITDEAGQVKNILWDEPIVIDFPPIQAVLPGWRLPSVIAPVKISSSPISPPAQPALNPVQSASAPKKLPFWQRWISKK
jgi:hypothetical protein